MNRRLKIIFTFAIIATIGLLVLNWWFIKIHPFSSVILAMIGIMMFAIIFLGIAILIDKTMSKQKKKFAIFMIAQGINGIVLINTFLIVMANNTGILKTDLHPIVPIITMCSFVGFIILTFVGVKVAKEYDG